MAAVRRPAKGRSLASVVLMALCGSSSLALLAGCQSAPPPPNVVLLSVDTMRADRVGLAGYARRTTPNIDRFFGEKGRIYTRSWSTEASTTPSVVSMLSGQLPQQHRVRQLIQLVPADLKLLPDLLPDPWQSAGFVSNMMLTNETSALGSHFDHFDDFVDERERYRGDTFERNAARTTDAVLDWFGKREADAASKQKPLFLWVHYMDPHGPYHPPDDWKRTFTHETPVPIDVQKVLEYEREPGVTDGLAYVDAYDEEVAYVDFHIGRLLDVLEKRLDPARTLYVFTADHGEAMMEHEFWFRHAVQVYEEMVRVPLLVRGPGVVPGRSDLVTSGTDIAPTVLAALGLPLAAPMPAVDLRDGKGLTADRIVYSEASLSARDGAEQWRCAVQGSAKWVLGVRKGNCESVSRRYDLAKDPGEFAPGPWTAEGEAPQSLLKLCREDPDPAGIPVAWAFGTGLKGPKLPDLSDDERLKSLKALGYAD